MATAVTKQSREIPCDALSGWGMLVVNLSILVIGVGLIISGNAILPGMFMTEPNQRWARENPAMIANSKTLIPMGDFGQPEDLGPLAVYLASDAARYMTGAGLVIDGGYTLW